MKIVFSVDVEKDLNSQSYQGVVEGLKRVEEVCDFIKTSPILFVTADCIQKYPSLFKRLKKKGWEISLHGLTHRRFDELNYIEKEHELTESINIFRNNLGIRPKGFRAPQHSIDKSTLNLLQKHGFEYDSSYTPFNLFQFIFFPTKIVLNTRLFFSKFNDYNILPRLREKPCSAFLLPFVSLTIRILPVWASRAYVYFLRFFYNKPMFYAHSWDFICQEKSKIDSIFSHEKLITKLKEVLK